MPAGSSRVTEAGESHPHCARDDCRHCKRGMFHWTLLCNRTRARNVRAERITAKKEKPHLKAELFDNEIRGFVQLCGATSERFRTHYFEPYSHLEKGGDPAAGSPTATLLRLRPSHRACLRPLPPLRVSTRTSGTPGSHGVMGGVYKARERIHRGVADPRLLAIPASCGRVADHNPNLDRLLAIGALLRVGDALYRPL